jgi:hypothetical protein
MRPFSRKLGGRDGEPAVIVHRMIADAGGFAKLMAANSWPGSVAGQGCCQSAAETANDHYDHQKERHP